MPKEHDAPSTAAPLASPPPRSERTLLADSPGAFRAGLDTIVDLANLCRQTSLDAQQQQYIRGILTAANNLKDALDGAGEDRGSSSSRQDSSTQLLQQALADAPSILLVEDDEINQAITCELLKLSHARIDVVSNGQEALDAIDAANAVEASEGMPYSLILMDVRMPIMNGLEATRRIRAKGYSMPIVAMTANNAPEDRERSLAAGMNDHLTKPLAPEELFNILAHWLPHLTVRAQTATTQNATLPPEIPGFNLVAGLAAVGNNQQLYADLLGKFAARYATITEGIATCLQSNDLEAAIRLAHTVKGLAANLGAEALADAAGALEKTIATEPGEIAPHLQQLVLRLAEAIDAVHKTLGTNTQDRPLATASVLTTSLSTEEARTLSIDLCNSLKYMENDWNTASDMAHKAYEILRGTQLEGTALMLVQEVEDFATRKAQDLGHTLRAALRNAYAPHPLHRSQTTEGSPPSST